MMISWVPALRFHSNLDEMKRIDVVRGTMTISRKYMVRQKSRYRTRTATIDALPLQQSVPTKALVPHWSGKFLMASVGRDRCSGGTRGGGRHLARAQKEREKAKKPKSRCPLRTQQRYGRGRSRLVMPLRNRTRWSRAQRNRAEVQGANEPALVEERARGLAKGEDPVWRARWQARCCRCLSSLLV